MRPSITRAVRSTTSGLALAALSLSLTGAAHAQEAPAAAPAPQDEAAPADEIVVTGFRASLNSALAQKRTEAAAIDSIVAEDIGKFPDSNLAESMQRVPGVALARGDGGEGKNISVRGLGPSFTRTRINGMEGASQTGASDIYGNANGGRSFDFNVFPTEIFSALTVRKTPSADVEEGSLGATVDLSAPKPLAQKEDLVLTATLRGVYTELAKKVNPRGSILLSKKFDDGRFGILSSFAYQKRDLREVGYSAVDILPADVNGGFCAPVGFTPLNPSLNPGKGITAENCSTGNPRTSTLAAYQAIYNARRPDKPNTPGSGAYFPRLPRYMDSTQRQERLGGTLTFQFQPDDATDISLDLFYSRFGVVRNDNYMEAVSFARSAANNGQPMTSVRDIQLDGKGSLLYGVFDGVDIRAEGLRDDFVSTFKQANLNFRHDFTDDFTITAMFGVNQSKLDGRQRFQYWMDAIDTDGFSIDARNGDTPVLGFGFDVSDPNNFQYRPGTPDGTVYGGFSLQNKPLVNTTDGLTSDFNLEWRASDVLALKAGGQFRSSDFRSDYVAYYTADTLVKALPAGTSLASITRQIEGVDKLWGNGAPSSWVGLDPDKLADTFGIFESRFCGVECGADHNRVREDVLGAYVMGKFDLSEQLGFGLRGDVGVRYVRTDQLSSTYIPIVNPASPTGVSGRYRDARRSYDDWLPSANVVVEPMRNLLLRFAGSKVMSRPQLGSLVPSSGINPVVRTGSIGNPLLDPIRAKTFDAAVEWYFAPGSLLSAAFFYKDIGTYVQTVKSLVRYDELGLPVELLAGTNTLPTEFFDIGRPTNTDGGPLKGIEVNAQVPFTFLPGPLHDLGLLANYTRVTSRIEYVLASANGVPTVTTTAALVGLSKNTASGTLYYEDRKFSIRGTVNYRDGFIRNIPGPTGSDLGGNDSTVYVDASMSYNVSDRLKIILEAQNLTDEQNRLYVDSQRDDTLFQTRVGRTVTLGVNVRL